VLEEHFEVELPDQDLDVERDRQAHVDVLADDLVRVAQDGDVRGLVGGEDRLRRRGPSRLPARGAPACAPRSSEIVASSVSVSTSAGPRRRSGFSSRSGATSRAL
jgi:hypothetical protein